MILRLREWWWQRKWKQPEWAALAERAERLGLAPMPPAKGRKGEEYAAFRERFIAALPGLRSTRFVQAVGGHLVPAGEPTSEIERVDMEAEEPKAKDGLATLRRCSEHGWIDMEAKAWQVKPFAGRCPVLVTSGHGAIPVECSEKLGPRVVVLGMEAVGD